MSATEYRKACDCKKSKATIGRTIQRNERTPDGIVVHFDFYPGPVCDGCNTPWKLKKSKKPKWFRGAKQ